MRRNVSQPQGRPNLWYFAAMVALAAMVVLNFPFWLDGSVEPAFFGLPIVLTYHIAFALLSVPVLWLVFTAIWPRVDNEDSIGAEKQPR